MKFTSNKGSLLFRQRVLEATIFLRVSRALTKERWISQKYWMPFFMCMPMDIFQARPITKNIGR